jgi:hypothetical protein
MRYIPAILALAFAAQAGTEKSTEKSTENVSEEFSYEQARAEVNKKFRSKVAFLERQLLEGKISEDEYRAGLRRAEEEFEVTICTVS